MEPTSSLPYSQAPATCPYSEPTPSSPHNPFRLPQDPSWYYPPIYVLVSPVVSFLQVSPPKPCAHLSLPPYVPHAPPISFTQILAPEIHDISIFPLRNSVWSQLTTFGSNVLQILHVLLPQGGPSVLALWTTKLFSLLYFIYWSVIVVDL